MFDVAVIGAGMAGLVCAQRLRQMGYGVVVVEKSRGLGGRMATRRLPGTWADHGVRCLENQGEFSQAIAQTLLEKGVLHLWTEAVYELREGGRLQESTDRHPHYVAAEGITAIAKSLAGGLEIWRGQRVQAIAAAEQAWMLTLEPPAGVKASPLRARAVVLAIPAPQALTLLESTRLPAELLSAVRSVEFAACITAIATYAAGELTEVPFEVPWRAAAFAASDLAWVGIESTKQFQPAQPVVVVQSAAEFADRYLNFPDLNQVGQALLASAAEWLPRVDFPELLQVHRWRYAFVSRPLSELCLGIAEPLPLVCAGDWCGGNRIENALQSGWAAAEAIATQMQAAPAAQVKNFVELLRSL